MLYSDAYSRYVQYPSSPGLIQDQGLFKDMTPNQATMGNNILIKRTHNRWSVARERRKGWCHNINSEYWRQSMRCDMSRQPVVSPYWSLSATHCSSRGTHCPVMHRKSSRDWFASMRKINITLIAIYLIGQNLPSHLYQGQRWHEKHRWVLKDKC